MPDPVPALAWSDRLPRILAGTQLICLCVAASLAGMGMPVWVALTHSLAIGNLSALGVHVGRWGWVAAQRRRQARRARAAGVSPPPASLAQRQGWPGRGPMAVVLLAAVGLAYPLGAWLARGVLGLAGVPVSLGLAGMRESGTDARTWLGLFVISLLPSLVGTLIFRGRARLAATEARLAELDRQAAEAELRALQSQLEPHMLFNTLANLRALIGIDPPQAQHLLDHMIAWLRRTLTASRLEQHPLSAEFDHLRDYLALMQMRMGPRLRTTLDLPEALSGLPLPPLLLQPLVENAIRHGLEPARRGGLLAVCAWREAGTLWLEVADSGVGLDGVAEADGRDAAAGHAGGARPPAGALTVRDTPTADRDRPASSGTGFGLHQVRERLATRYGPDAAALSLQPREGGGTVARIRLPVSPSSTTSLDPSTP